MKVGHRTNTGKAWWLIAAGSFVITAVLLSPYALDAFGADERWQDRSTIGQTYGAVSALLAALGLGGVAVSVLLQARESKANREFAMRSAHTELIMAAINDPDLRECIAIFDEGYTETQKRQHLYCNLMFSFWETRYVLGELKRSEIAGLAESMTNGEPGRRFWLATRAYRLRHIDSPRALEFRTIFDDAFRQLTAAALSEHNS